MSEECRFIIFGPPAAGKGTQSKNIVENFKCVHLSTGDLLRQAVQEETEVGKQAKEFMNKGDLVPDEVIIGVVIDALKKPQNSSFLLDGFPRSLGQAEALSKYLNENGTPLNAVVNLNVPEDVLEERICGRRIHKPSGRSYHVKFNPPKVEGKDDKTGEDLIQRADDTAEALKTRLANFNAQTMPVLEFFKNVQPNSILEIDGNKEMDQIWNDINDGLETKFKEKSNSAPATNVACENCVIS